MTWQALVAVIVAVVAAVLTVLVYRADKRTRRVKFGVFLETEVDEHRTKGEAEEELDDEPPAA